MERVSLTTQTLGSRLVCRWRGLTLVGWYAFMSFGVLALWSVMPPQAMAKPAAMTVQDVLTLLQVGYKEADVLAEIKKRNMLGQFALKPKDVIQLRKAGASLALIKSMGIARPPTQAAPQPVGFQEVQQWLKASKPEAWIQQQIKTRGLKVSEFSMGSILQLRKQGMSIQMLRFLVQKKNSQPKPASRNQPQKPPVLRTLPAVEKPLTKDPVLKRMVPAPRTQPNARRTVPVGQPIQTTRWGVQMKSKRPLTEREKKAQVRKGKRIPRPKDGRFVHTTGLFHLNVPAKWNIVYDLFPVSGQPRLGFTPESELQVAKLKNVVWISVEYVAKNDRSTLKQSLMQTARQVMQRYFMKEPDVREKEPIKKTRFNKKHPAVQITLEGKAREELQPLRKRFYLLRYGRTYLQVGVSSSPKEFAAFWKQAEPVLQSLTLHSEPTHLSVKRKARAMAPQAVIQKSMPGIVSIMCMVKKNGKLKPASSGSGFVVTSDGYVITNHHVAFNSRAGKAYDAYYLNWDSSTGRKFVTARFVAAHRKMAERRRVRMVDSNTGRISVRFQRQHVDIALLKITTKGTYPTVPLSPIKHAMLGDQVVAMGFPSEGASINTMGNESITTTMGSISRMVRLADKRVNEIQHSAKVAGGNSGGPLFDVHTGAVIGINTWVGIFDKRLPRPGMGLGYYYALPIDLVWQYFPDYVSPKAKTYDAYEWYEWGNKWLANQQWAPARRAFLRVIQKMPNFAPAYMQMANLYLTRAGEFNDDRRHDWLKLSRRWADKGLRKDLGHPQLMAFLSRIALESEDWNTAQYLLRQLTQKAPFDWEVFLLRAAMYNLQGKTNLALQDARRVIRMAGKMIPTGYLMRGSILYRAGRYFEGQQAYRKALQIDPSNLTAQIQEAAGYTQLKQYDDALSRLNALTKEHKFEPGVFRGMMVAYTLKKDFQNAWKSFLSQWRSAMLRQQTVDVDSLYLGGLLAQRVLSTKVKPRLVWGLWGSAFHLHSKATTAKRVGLMLAARAYRKRWTGLAYGLLKLVQPPIKDVKLKKLYNTLQKRLQYRGVSHGISQQAWLFVATQTYPSWSPSLVWKLFQNTPSYLALSTAKKMARKGFSIGLLKKMLKISALRQKRGVLRRQPQGQQQSPNNLEGSSALQRHRRRIVGVVNQAILALNTENPALWVRLHDSRRAAQHRRMFWAYVSKIQSGMLALRSFSPPQIRFQKHPRLGLVAYYYFRMRLGRSVTKRYWQLYYSNGRWVLF